MLCLQDYSKGAFLITIRVTRFVGFIEGETNGKQGDLAFRKNNIRKCSAGIEP